MKVFFSSLLQNLTWHWTQDPCRFHMYSGHFRCWVYSICVPGGRIHGVPLPSIPWAFLQSCFHRCLPAKQLCQSASTDPNGSRSGSPNVHVLYPVTWIFLMGMCVSLGIEPRAFSTVGKCSATELHPRPQQFTLWRGASHSVWDNSWLLVFYPEFIEFLWDILCGVLSLLRALLIDIISFRLRENWK